MRASGRVLVPLMLVASAQAASYEVTVGKGGQLKFEPETLKAEVGDTITYLFFAKNHSVVQSSFAEPCQPLKDGFFSGFVPNQLQDTASRTTFTITVKDKNPKWVYCSQGNHCQSGMVHAINPPESGNTIDAYREAAKKATANISPPNLPVNGVRRTTVDVGKDSKLIFEPSSVTEPKGTVVEFLFHPKNHSVVQSSFDNPCQPLSQGFSSGFIPASVSPSGVVFEYTVENDKPVWFYCAQNTGKHCQSGMVGAINAPAQGNTLEAFTAKAKAAQPPSSIPDHAPLGGIVKVNGTTIPTFNGAVLPSSSSPPSTTTTTSTTTAPSTGSTNPPTGMPTLPPPSPDTPQYYISAAGGGKPATYNWSPTLSLDTTILLQLHTRLEDTLLHLLWSLTTRLSPGDPWAGLYPPAIVGTISAWTAQSVIHRATVGEVLMHYNYSVPTSCEYKFPGEEEGIDSFVKVLVKLLAVQIGAAIDISSRVADKQGEGFVVPLLVTQVGAKSRAAGVVNMMVDHMAAAAPREVAVPASLAWGFVKGRFVEKCEEGIEGLEEPEGWAVLGIGEKVQEGGRVVKVDLVYDGASGEQWVAWLGPYGLLEFTKVEVSGGKKSAAVPQGWYGDVWIVVVNQSGIKLDQLDEHVVAGPEMVWIAEP